MTRVVLVPFRVASHARAAGHFWVYVQYADALRRIGCDVWWLEELPAQPDPGADQVRIATLLDRLRPFGMAEQVILFRAAGDGDEPTYLTGSAAAAERVFRDADLLLNFHYELPTSVLVRFRRTALVDIDPGLLQLWWANDQLHVHRHDVYFSIGEHLPGVPGEEGTGWVHTSPAVSLDLWPYRYDPACSTYTTISSWSSESYVLLDGRMFDTNKRVAYLQHAELPRRTDQPLEIATAIHEEEVRDRRLMDSHGWRVREAGEVAADPWRYQGYIQASRGEFGFAKPAYVLLGNAWVSDRTACYLASGKPAVVEHTGPSAFLPEGPGLLRFSGMDQAVAALDDVEAHYEKHCRAAREIAETFFSAADVVTRMLDHALAQ